jgi:cytochrome c oxidase assembly factor CtaG
MTVAGVSGPYAWDPHLLTWAVLAVLVGAVVLGHRRLQAASKDPIHWTRRQIIQFAGAVTASAVALTWPLADLAAHWSLTALVMQRLIVVLVVAPLLLLGLPYGLLQWATRPAGVDAVLVRLQRPPVAIITVTILLIGSMTPGVVHAQSVSVAVRATVAGVVLVAGLVLWIPVLGRIPGILRPKPVVRFGYLVAQAVVPAFLSFIYIFSTHPLYADFSRAHAAVGLRPLNDQQIAGFVSKLSMLLVLLSVGWVVLSRASTADEEFAANDPLVWADVERQFERVDRRSARSGAVGGSDEVAVGSGDGTPGQGDDSPAGIDPTAPTPPPGRPPEGAHPPRSRGDPPDSDHPGGPSS